MLAVLSIMLTLTGPGSSQAPGDPRQRLTAVALYEQALDAAERLTESPQRLTQTMWWWLGQLEAEADRAACG
jgi:hypothetical protein